MGFQTPSNQPNQSPPSSERAEWEDLENFDEFDDGFEAAIAQSELSNRDGNGNGTTPDRSLRRGMQPHAIAQQQTQTTQRERRRQVHAQQQRHERTQTRLAMALDDQDERFKQKVYELVVEYDLDTDDPLFLVLLSTGRLEVLLEERPQELGALFDQWEERVYTQLKGYKEGLEIYERTAVKAQEKAIAQSVTSLIRGTVFDKFIHSFTLASVGLATVLGLTAAGLGGWVGYQLQAAQAKAIEYAPGKPRQLTLEEANALNWAMSAEGQQARQLVEWNRDLLAQNACEQQTQALGLTLTLQGQKGEAGSVCPVGASPSRGH